MALPNFKPSTRRRGHAGVGMAVSARKISKRFGATTALDNASFEAARGDVHALLGENGAGKSTLVKLLSGLLRPDSGILSIFGSEVEFGSPTDAHACGVQTAFQELSLVPDLTVADNLLMPYQPIGILGQVRGKYSDELIAEDLRKLKIFDVTPRQILRTLSLPVRQKLEIVRAVRRQPAILLLDEPTSALSGPDIEWLGGIIDGLKNSGVTVIFISHRLDEVRRFCDALTVLRNGRNVGSFPLSDVADDEIIKLIAGREIASVFPERPQVPKDRQIILMADRLSAGRLEQASFSLAVGEILGVAGLQGMGQLELFLALFGDIKLRSGTITLDGEVVAFNSPRDAVENGVANIGLVPEGRGEALFFELDGRANVSLPSIDRFEHLGLIDSKSETNHVAELLRRVNVDLRALYAPVYTFSGGNQQKLILAKWLLLGCRVMLLYDPTRGVDITTKHEIYLLINEYVKRGGSVIIYSTDIDEIVNLSHRVLLVYGGKIVRELQEDEISHEGVIRSVLGERLVTEEYRP
jgi:ribose transport system ATP-binding protein